MNLSKDSLVTRPPQTYVKTGIVLGREHRAGKAQLSPMLQPQGPQELLTL